MSGVSEKASQLSSSRRLLFALKEARAELEAVELTAWGEQTRHSFSLDMFHGGHFFLNDAPDPLLRAISKKLSAQINKRGTV